MVWTARTLAVSRPASLRPFVNVNSLPASDLVAPSAVDVNTSVSLVSQTIDWINTNGGTWTDAANANVDWSTGNIPTSVDVVVINLSGSGSYTVTIPSGKSQTRHH